MVVRSALWAVEPEPRAGLRPRCRDRQDVVDHAGTRRRDAPLIAAGALLLLSTTNAELIVARASPTKFDELRRYRVAESAVWAHPALAPRVVLIKDVDTLICWSLQDVY